MKTPRLATGRAYAAALFQVLSKEGSPQMKTPRLATGRAYAAALFQVLSKEGSPQIKTLATGK